MRYFISRPTDGKGEPIPEAESDPTFFRCTEAGTAVELLVAGEWEPSIIRDLMGILSDCLGGGATVREIMDEEVSERGW